MLAHLAGSHVTILVSHLIGLKIKIYMAPGDTLVMTSLIRSAARRSRPIMLWEHGGFANGEHQPCLTHSPGLRAQALPAALLPLATEGPSPALLPHGSLEGC